MNMIGLGDILVLIVMALIEIKRRHSQLITRNAMILISIIEPLIVME